MVEEKTHWKNLKQLIKILGSSKIEVDSSDGLPIKARVKELKKEEFDLTKEEVI